WQGFQEITFETEEEAGSNASNLKVNLKDVNMGDFIPLFMKRPRIEGLANGSIYLRDFYNKFNADATIKAEQFRLDDDSIGVVMLDANYNNESGKINFNYKSDNDHYAFIGNGYYNIKDTTNTGFRTTMHLNNTKIGLV